MTESETPTARVAVQFILDLVDDAKTWAKYAVIAIGGFIFIGWPMFVVPGLLVEHTNRITLEQAEQVSIFFVMGWVLFLYLSYKLVQITVNRWSEAKTEVEQNAQR